MTQILSKNRGTFFGNLLINQLITLVTANESRGQYGARAVEERKYGGDR